MIRLFSGLRMFPNNYFKKLSQPVIFLFGSIFGFLCLTGIHQFRDLYSTYTTYQRHYMAEIQVNDTKLHDQDQHTVADKIAKSIRLLCWVMTQPANHKTKAIRVKETWGKRCDKLLFVSVVDDGTLPFIVVNVTSGRETLSLRRKAGFDYVYKHHLDEYDWFLKADDDTYVIVENLKYFLTSQNTSKPLHFGHHFKTLVRQGYFSGGAGYVLSREALRLYGANSNKVCVTTVTENSDVEMGQCLQDLGVVAGDSRDSLGRSRFHCFQPSDHLAGGYPNWYFQYDKYGGKHGVESISDYAISFHYVTPQLMNDLEFFVYHLRPYGILNELQNLNGQTA